MKEKFLEGLKKLRKESEKRGFDQSVDLIINLADLDIRKTSINLFLSLPHKVKERKICAFLEKKSGAVDKIITKAEISSLDKKEIKKLAKEYDWFIASASVMPTVATVLGKILGPLGKMPNPRFGGVMMKESEDAIKATITKLKNSINIRPKETSVKIGIGKESMQDKELAENAEAIYNALLAALPRKKENIKSILLKFTMSKPIKI